MGALPWQELPHALLDAVLEETWARQGGQERQASSKSLFTNTGSQPVAVVFQLLCKLFFI